MKEIKETVNYILIGIFLAIIFIAFLTPSQYLESNFCLVIILLGMGLIDLKVKIKNYEQR